MQLWIIGSISAGMTNMPLRLACRLRYKSDARARKLPWFAACLRLSTCRA